MIIKYNWNLWVHIDVKEWREEERKKGKEGRKKRRKEGGKKEERKRKLGLAYSRIPNNKFRRNAENRESPFGWFSHEWSMNAKAIAWKYDED